MRAAWYDIQGSAADVLKLGELDLPEVGAHEVRVRVTFSGINPGDTKKRSGWLGSKMPYERVIPHSDASGVIDAVGPGVDSSRVGRRVWVFGAQSYRPFGTAAEFVIVPNNQAIDLPDSVTDEDGAALGIPGITAHRTVFADGPVGGQTVLVHGVLGAVSSIAIQLARSAGANIIGTVRNTADLSLLDSSLATRTVALDDPDPVASIRRLAPDGVDRIVEVALSDNVDIDVALIRNNTTIATYFSRLDAVTLPFAPLLFDNVTVRFFGSDDFPMESKTLAAHALTEALASKELSIQIARVYPLSEIALAHDEVDSGSRGRVLLQIADEA